MPSAPGRPAAKPEPSRLQRELKMRRGFAHPALEGFLALVRTTDALQRGAEALLKQHDLSPAGYNVLRILRGAAQLADPATDPERTGLTCGAIAERLVTWDPDITRLLDRLDRLGLITRCRGASDRRTVRACLTPAGRALCDALEAPLDALHERQLAALTARELATLITLLGKVRQGYAPAT